MLHKNIKLAIAVGLLATAVWQFTEGNIGNGIMLIIIMALVILLYFKNEIMKIRKIVILFFIVWFNVLQRSG